jgi:drug/metabolite transporter (DMT)-like permease
VLSRADLLLLFVSAIWGTTFALLRDSLRVIHPAELMAIRFSIAAVVLGAIFWRRLWPVRRRWLLDGAWLGVWVAIAYLTQVIGLATISSSRSAFITSTYIFFTPFLAIVMGAGKPGLGDLVGVALAFGGIYLFNSGVGFALGPGELWTLGCAFSFGIQIVITSIVAKRSDAVALSWVQIAVCAVFAWIFVAGRGGFHTPFTHIPWGVLIYLGVMATALVIVIQTWAMARTTPVKAALLFATEPIFASIFAVSFYGETMSRAEVWGGALIILGVIVTELWRPIKARFGPRRGGPAPG